MGIGGVCYSRGGMKVVFVYVGGVHAMIKPFGLALRKLFLLQYDLILKKISSRKTFKSSNFMTSYFESRATAEAFFG